MEGIPQEKQEKPKEIQKMEIIVSGQDGPGENFGIKINGRNDLGFLLGRSKFFEVVSKEDLAALFPDTFEVSEKEGRKIFKVVGRAKHLLKNEGGLRQLANRLGITIEILTQGNTKRELEKGEFEHRSIEPSE
jgi:hypothetical protein